MQEIHIAYDSREQRPLHSLGAENLHASTRVVYHRAALETFDYCLWRDWRPCKEKVVTPHWAIERKSIADFIGTWFNKDNKRREKAKIKRARAWAPRAIIYVLEGGMQHVAAYDYRRFPTGRIDAKVVESQIDKLRYDGVQVVMAGSRLLAEYVIVSLLKRRAASLPPKHWRQLWADEKEQGQ